MCDNQNPDTIMGLMLQVQGPDIMLLLDHFSKNSYSAKTEDAEAKKALDRCIHMLGMDYNLFTVLNTNGDLSAHYPSQLPIPEYENVQNLNISGNGQPQASQRTTNTIYENSYDMPKLRDLFSRAKNARCRARFPVPVILYRGKYVCRSSTLSGGPEIYGRSGLEYLFPSSDAPLDSKDEMDNTTEVEMPSSQSDWQLFDRVRNQDIKLLKTLNIGTIVDLMVEKKKVKFGMNVTSSEKVDKENRYSDFNIISLPYPGCEFFKDFRDNNFNGEGLVFDWNQEQCDATVSVPDNPLLTHLHIDWNNYKKWDLIKMTQNYIRYLLKYLQDNSSGLLVHCISGWDRTPLFISLLRLSLWADGLAHQSLDEHQILYFTIAYDWMLFGHRLSDRIDKGEEIFFFCFYMLKYLISDEFSVAPGRHKLEKQNQDKAPEDNVNRTDSDSQLELLLEQDLRGSNISLNSTCSSVSSKSQEPTVYYQHNDEPNGNTPTNSLDVRDVGLTLSSSSPQARRTSPVTVPVTRLKRTESSMTTNSSQSTHSNNSSGSWAVVTWTGSLRGSDTQSNNDLPFSQNSVGTVVDGDDWLQEPVVPPTCRKDRLIKVRELFYLYYFKSIGSRTVKYVPDSSISAIFGNFAEKVGLSQRNN